MVNSALAMDVVNSIVN